MKKNLGVAIAGIAMLALVGCIGVQHGEIIENVEADVETSQVVTVANPWSDCTEEEAYVDAPNGFTAPEIDITGCDTFTQIVDQKLSKGMGYANVTLNGEDVLLVCSMAYDNLDGNMAAIDATIFMYKDGVPCEVGSKVTII